MPETQAQIVETPEHTCPYEVSLTEYQVRHFGGASLNSARLDSLGRQIAAMHADGQCPPTHVNEGPAKGPTRVWADWVQGLHQ